MNDEENKFCYFERNEKYWHSVDTSCGNLWCQTDTWIMKRNKREYQCVCCQNKPLIKYCPFCGKELKSKIKNETCKKINLVCTV